MMIRLAKKACKGMAACLIMALMLAGCTGKAGREESPGLTERFNEALTQAIAAYEPEAFPEPSGRMDRPGTGQAEPVMTWNGAHEIPAYSGEPWAELADGIPYFTEQEKTAEAFESYSELDSLGRCGQAYANICRETMPTEERGQIGQVKPSGWHTVKYPGLISDLYLYNRCHLIGYQLAGENANERNLITGTRSMNIDGMLDFENQIDGYVEETGNHVLYRVTPLFYEDELVCRGVEMEALSVEDGGEGIRFHVFAYNRQPGITIDYATGDSRATEGADEETKRAAEGDAGTADPEAREYALNISSMKFHLPGCDSVKKIKEENLRYWTCTRDELIEDGYSPCGACHP